MLKDTKTLFLVGIGLRSLFGDDDDGLPKATCQYDEDDCLEQIRSEVQRNMKSSGASPIVTIDQLLQQLRTKLIKQLQPQKRKPPQRSPHAQSKRSRHTINI